MPALLPEISQIIEMIRLASTTIPSDVADALAAGRARSDGNAAVVLGEIIDNCSIAAGSSVPMCQDTGIPLFYVAGTGLDFVSRRVLVERIFSAVRTCVSDGLLRPNSVDALSGRNSGDGTGDGIPQVHFDDESDPAAPLTISLLLKGGGSENMGRQYSLPGDLEGAGRDLDGVRKCVVDAAFRAQGFGCAPGILGVCIGGDRSSGMAMAKRQLLRRLDDPPGPFDELERGLVESINRLGIGPMGLGGCPTVLGVRVAALPRHPASFFVSVAYGCWATRRCRMLVSADGACVLA